MADRYLADMGRCRQRGDEAREAAGPKSERYAAAASWYSVAEHLEELARAAVHEAES